MARTNLSFLQKIFIVCCLYCLGQILVYQYGARKELGQVPGFKKRLYNEWTEPRQAQDITLFRRDSHKRAAFIANMAQQLLAAGNQSKTILNSNHIAPNTTTTASPDKEVENDTEKNKILYHKVQRSNKHGAFVNNFTEFDGKWNSSFVSPQHHRHYNVNCAALVYGNRDTVKITNAMLRKSNKEPLLRVHVPHDDAVKAWTAHCELFRTERRYPDKPFTQEEVEYPVAYIILTHKESAQVERLLRVIYQPQNVYCIHPDAKSSSEFQAAIRGLADCFENVFIASKLETVQYAGFTRLQADINCMGDLLKHPVQWKYVMNLCGQDFPLKTNLEIVRQLKAYKGKNDINGIIPPPYIKGRTRAHYKIINGTLIATRLRKSPPPYNLTIYFGNAYYAASRPFVHYVINNDVAVDLLEWSMDTFSPDEHYWVTLHRAPGVPGGYPHPTWHENVRFMKWGDIGTHPPCQGVYVRALCVFGVGYLNYLSKMPHLFANKFYYSFDPVILQCIEELLDYRTAYPETISDFVSYFPVTNLTWQLN